jgi:signal transduction histidine kinase
LFLAWTETKTAGPHGPFPDLTEIKALEEEVARSQRLASLGSLAAGVAHEIRNPLSSIKGFATSTSKSGTGQSRGPGDRGGHDQRG